MTHIQAIEALGAAYGFIASPTDGGGWDITFPDLPGCTSWAERWEDIGRNAREASELYLEVLAEHGRMAPAPLWRHNHLPREQVVVLDPAGPTLTSTDVAKVLGISQRRVQALSRSRNIGRRVGNYVIYRQEDVEALRPGKPGRPRRTAPVSS